MKLFVIYIGGMMAKSLIEVHDLRLVAGEKIEDSYEELKNNWWGIAKALHIDCHGILTYADGYNISLKAEPQNFNKRLFFANLGGYNCHKFTELHKNLFVVASNQAEAKIRALKQISRWQNPHRDNLYAVENVALVSEVRNLDTACYVHLAKTKIKQPFKFTCEYILLP